MTEQTSIVPMVSVNSTGNTIANSIVAMPLRRETHRRRREENVGEVMEGTSVSSGDFRIYWKPSSQNLPRRKISKSFFHLIPRDGSRSFDRRAYFSDL